MRRQAGLRQETQASPRPTAAATTHSARTTNKGHHATLQTQPRNAPNTTTRRKANETVTMVGPCLDCMAPKNQKFHQYFYFFHRPKRCRTAIRNCDTKVCPMPPIKIVINNNAPKRYPKLHPKIHPKLHPKIASENCILKLHPKIASKIAS